MFATAPRANSFDELKVAEVSANSLLMASSIGPLLATGNQEIDELRAVFKVKVLSG